jgi:hypothetical protein
MGTNGNHETELIFNKKQQLLEFTSV